MLVKFLGVMDILAAIALVTGFSFGIGFIIFLVHMVKGLMSMTADPIGIAYGFVDIISAIAILFAINLGILGVIFAVILGLKGAMSLI